MTDRELLELAAKAAGKDIDPHRYDPDDGFAIRHTAIFWNPIDDDGDALRLAVKLGILHDHYHKWKKEFDLLLACDLKPSEATRRAIVRAAAEIGRGMK